MSRRALFRVIPVAIVAGAFLLAIAASAAPSPKFKSEVVRSGAVSIDADISGASNLWLVVTDGGDGFGCDWADWIEPRLAGPSGSAKLTELKWKQATAGFGTVRVNQNAQGQPLRVGGQAVSYGIGTHSPSVIHFEIAGRGFTRFQAQGGLDNGGTDQGCGSTVQFLVFTEKPADELIAAAAPASPAGPRSGAEAAEKQLQQMTIAEGLEATLFAVEPMVRNPANMEIDARGRVWVTEGANYRRWRDLRPEGDRIVILEDTDLDGRADKETTFYQGPDINTALGICVLGSRVIVSCSPNVFIFTDENDDGKADKKEIFFTGIAGVQHDHGVHAFVFGPDGKLYFNFGNESRQLRRPDGSPVIDRAGNEVAGNGKPYRQGMVFRCNLDGSDFETLGFNFRNNYEVGVDSFGTLWQSDNDDDGNRGVRINYVMDYGNFGYTDEMTGAGWSQKRTGIEADVPNRHWHQNDPGVVPNLLLTGAGSPTGILVYEGRLLPERFRNQIIHCDAGPRVVRAYRTERDGAGFRAEIADLMTSSDTWFRPSDVCVAPDGALFVTDWNDAGVGGHHMADQDVATMTGRIYRMAPKGNKPALPKLDLSSVEGAVQALQSPNLATRHLGWTRLNEAGAKAESALRQLWRSSDSRMRARAFHLLVRIPGRTDGFLKEAMADANPDIRSLVLRWARAEGKDASGLVAKLVRDAAPAVRRECALSLCHSGSPDAPKLWAELAAQHDGNDRWYLEALGIGADRQWDAYLGAWLEKIGDGWNTPAGRDVIWRSRAKRTPALLVQLIKSEKTGEAERARYFRALDFVAGPEKDAALLELLTTSTK